MPLHTADALVLRTYKLGEADRIVVFLTARPRQEARCGGRRPAPPLAVSRRARAVDPRAGGVLRERAARAGRRQLRRDRHARRSSSPSPEALGYSHYFAELHRRVGRRGRRRRAAVPAGDRDARGAWWTGCAGRAAGALLRVLAAAAAGGLPGRPVDLARRRRRSSTGVRRVAPRGVEALGASTATLRELERVHRTLIRSLLDRELRSIRVLHELRRVPAP